MNDRIDWREIAASDGILSSADSLMEQALGICDDGPFEDRYDACQCLMQYGKASVEAGQWRGALWLKRLNELRLRQFGSEGIDEIAAFLHPRLHGVLAERLESNGRTLEEWQNDPMAITREVFADQHDESVIPGLLMATQIRLLALKNSGDDGLVAETAALEADMYGDAGFLRDAEETIRSACGVECEDYAKAMISLATAHREKGDLREAYRLAEDAGRPEVVKDAVDRQLVPLLTDMLRVELTGDMRLMSPDVNSVTDELGGPTNAMKVFRSHVMKMMRGEKLSDDDLLEGAHQFAACARHSELMKSSEGAVAGFVGALKQLLSMGDFSSHASFAKELMANAKAHGDSASDDLRSELDSLGRMVEARCDEPKIPSPMQAPKAAFGLESIAAKLADRLSGNEPK